MQKSLLSYLLKLIQKSPTTTADEKAISCIAAKIIFHHKWKYMETFRPRFVMTFAILSTIMQRPRGLQGQNLCIALAELGSSTRLSSPFEEQGYFFAIEKDPELPLSMGWNAKHRNSLIRAEKDLDIFVITIS